MSQEENRFVLISMQRTGSTMLRSILNSNPNIKCYGELMRRTSSYPVRVLSALTWYLHESFCSGQMPFLNRERNDYRIISEILEKRSTNIEKLIQQIDPRFKKYRTRVSNPYHYIDAVLSKANRDVKGFTLHIGQNNRFLQQLAEDKRYKKIFLVRNNHLAQYSSWRLALLTNRHSATMNEQLRIAKIKFRKRAFLKYIRHVEKQIEYTRFLLNANNLYCFEIAYTDLTSNERIHELLGYLGVKSGAFCCAKTKKRNTSNILDRFVNPEDVIRELKRIDRLEWQYETLN